jgi:DNA-binding PadR family transcriptional regulator
MNRIPNENKNHHNHHDHSFESGFGDRRMPRDFAARAAGFGAGFPGSGFPGGRGHGGPGFGGDFGRGFGPRGGGGRAGRGDIRAAILSLLGDAPSNGYGLIKAIAEKTNGAWRPSPGSVYPTLQQLVDEELITSVGEGRRTEFELTDAGKAYLVEHETEIAQAWAATPGRSSADAAFHESVGKLMGVVGQFRIGTTDAQRTAAVEKLDEARRALYLILAD